MPEGDTLYRLAMAMAPRLEGELVERVELEHVELEAFRGLLVHSVRAMGKHLLIAVGDLYLRTHLGLEGSWHRYPSGVAWKRPTWQASMLIARMKGRSTYWCPICQPAVRVITDDAPASLA